MAIKRKVQLTGRSTYTLSLPRDWIDRLKIEQGDELSILELEDGNLLISKEELTVSREKEVVIDLDEIEDEDLLEKIIISKYLAGYSKTTIRSNKEIPSRISKIVSSIVNNLIGSEIISEGLNHIEIRDLAIHGEFPIDKAVRRAHLIARNMQKIAIESFINSDSDNVSDVFEREDSVDRLYFLIRREITSALENPTILKELNMNSREVLYVYPVAKSLEKIADHSESIAQACLDLQGKKVDKKIGEYLLNYSKEAMEIHTQAILSFLGKRRDLAVKALNVFDALNQKLEDGTLNRERVSDIDVEIQIQFVERNLDRICGYGMDIAEMAIDRIH
ncbi:MAG: hypothetical protein GF308_12930 [Candidatus Heimdallarchaeota archaeon]|nr:hypothetical protein [Candidatus Heimdallarchaeota archaeon]